MFVREFAILYFFFVLGSPFIHMFTLYRYIKQFTLCFVEQFSADFNMVSENRS